MSAINRFWATCVLASGASSARDPIVLLTSPPAYATRLCRSLARIPKLDVRTAPTIETVLFDVGSEEAENLIASLRCEENDVDKLLAFTSRRGIEAVFSAASCRDSDDTITASLLSDHGSTSTSTTALALGADADLLVDYGVKKHNMIRPLVSSPNGIVSTLKDLVTPEKRRNVLVLCPVPRVDPPLAEPPVVPTFLSSLRDAGFLQVRRIDAYVTRLSPVTCGVAVDLLERGEVDVLAVTSTAEIDALRHRWKERKVDMMRGTGVSIVAHGPVTADGIRRAGYEVSEVSKNFSSFDGLVDAIESVLESRKLEEGMEGSRTDGRPSSNTIQ